MNEVCAFSGHRMCEEEPDGDLLERILLNLIKTGTNTFLCGMAVGFDLFCAEKVLEIKKNYDIKLIACIPCREQSSSFSSANKAVYGKILENCDEIKVLYDYYFKGCMQARDRYLVDNSDVLVCFLRRNRGGTYYTVKYAEKCGKKIIKI